MMGISNSKILDAASVLDLYVMGGISVVMAVMNKIVVRNEV